MKEYSDYIIALKPILTRRFISSTDSKGKKLFESDLNITIPELMNFGVHVVTILKDGTRNKFWEDVLQSWTLVYKANISKQCKNISNDHLCIIRILQLTKKHSFLKIILIMG